MFQPVLRVRSQEELDAEWASVEHEQALIVDARLQAEIWGEPTPVAEPVVPVPSSPSEWAWEDLTRSIPAARQAEARLLASLLRVHRASEDETIARYGVESLERNQDMDRAFRSEAAMALDIGDQELTTLVWHLDLAEQWLPGMWAALLDGRLNRRALQTIVRESPRAQPSRRFAPRRYRPRGPRTASTSTGTPPPTTRRRWTRSSGSAGRRCG